MKRRALRSLMLLAALTGACGSSQTTPPNTADDLGINTHDDMASAPRDMSPPALTGFNCPTANVTAAMVASTVIVPNCTGSMGGCHVGSGASEPPMYGNTGASLIAATVNQPSSATMNYITPRDINKSYLLYKVYGEHLKVSMGSGSQMPLEGGPLSDTNRCLLVNWVLSGAQ